MSVQSAMAPPACRSALRRRGGPDLALGGPGLLLSRSLAQLAATSRCGQADRSQAEQDD